MLANAVPALASPAPTMPDTKRALCSIATSGVKRKLRAPFLTSALTAFCNKRNVEVKHANHPSFIFRCSMASEESVPLTVMLAFAASTSWVRTFSVCIFCSYAARTAREEMDVPAAMPASPEMTDGPRPRLLATASRVLPPGRPRLLAAAARLGCACAGKDVASKTRMAARGRFSGCMAASG